MGIILGQIQAAAILKKLLREKKLGRTLILLGDKGIGKFSLAAGFAENILGKNPYLSTDFKFYRNDDFSLKTRFFIKNTENQTLKGKIKEYFFYFMGRISAAVSYNEIGKSSLKLKKPRNSGLQKAGRSESYGIMEFRNNLEEILLNERLFDEMGNNQGFAENCISVSDELSRKKRIPIDFIRDLIEYNSRKPYKEYKVSVLGNFENSTDEAQNSSLKLFEEPSASSIIILTANSIDNILPTILSRSVIIRMNKLSPSVLREIFGLKEPVNFYNTVDLMEDRVYRYSLKKRDRIIDFFSRIAPKVQFENEIFSFIEEITSDENNKLSQLFLLELVEFFRNLHLARQEYIRPPLKIPSIDMEYRKIIPGIIPHINTAEIAEIVAEISGLLQAIRYNNITDRNVFPSLLINIARWYQKKSK